MRQVPATRVREAMLFLLRRPIWLALVIFGIVLGVGLSMYGSLALPGGISNVELNIGTGLLEALITVAIIGPIIAYIQEGRVREHPRLDHNWFLDRAKEARSRLQILTTYSDLLTDQENADRFLAVIRGALSKRANVEILLLNPDSLSAEQRQQELQASTDLQGGILHNLRRLHAFAGSLDARQRHGGTSR